MLENEEIGSLAKILKIISINHSIDFTKNRQQDAAEFMTRLLDCLYNSVLEREKQEFMMLFKTENEKKRTCTVSNIYGCQTVNDIEKLDIHNTTSNQELHISRAIYDFISWDKGNHNS